MASREPKGQSSRERLLATGFDRLGDDQALGASSCFERASASVAGTEAHLAAASALVAGRPRRALRILRRLVRAAPDDCIALAQLAEIEVAVGDAERAGPLLERARAAAPREGVVERARELVRNALALSRDSTGD